MESGVQSSVPLQSTQAQRLQVGVVVSVVRAAQQGRRPADVHANTVLPLARPVRGGQGPHAQGIRLRENRRLRVLGARESAQTNFPFLVRQKIKIDINEN